jgi:hypothetical protein
VVLTQGKGQYEEMRKQPLLWDMFTKHAAELGMQDFHIIIMQEVVYNSLSPPYRDIFFEIDLNSKFMLENNLQMMYDKDAKYMYYHLLE